jgi:hypothetical protein
MGRQGHDHCAGALSEALHSPVVHQEIQSQLNDRPLLVNPNRSLDRIRDSLEGAATTRSRTGGAVVVQPVSRVEVGTNPFELVPNPFK